MKNIIIYVCGFFYNNKIFVEPMLTMFRCVGLQYSNLKLIVIQIFAQWKGELEVDKVKENSKFWAQT